MPKELYDVDGNKVEDALTKEDFDKQVAEATAKAVEEAQKSGTVVPKSEVEKLQADLKVAQDTLAKADDKDKNFSELRKKAEQAEKDLKEFKDGVAKDVETLKSQVGSSESNLIISQLADGDLEAEKKIRFHLGRISKPDDTPEQKKQNLIDAATLAKGSRPAPNIVNGIVSSAGAVNKEFMGGSEGDRAIKPELMGLAKNLGLSDKDIDKFGKK